MKYRIYKSLDKSASLFGIAGSYKKITIVLLAADFLVSLIVGKATLGLVGVGVFAALLVVIYIGMLAFQSKYTERERDKWLASFRIPDFTSVPPRILSDYATTRRSFNRRLSSEERDEIES